MNRGAVVVLTGAGISRESGLYTFRDEGGVWSQVNLEDVATPGGFARDPEGVNRFYNERRQQLLDSEVQPNDAHRALARLEREWEAEVCVITQNIDNLHERAGSNNVLHMHGELARVRCDSCGKGRAWTENVAEGAVCEACGQTGHLRPDVVWFGEIPFRMEEIEAALDDCSMFLSIGTSGSVWPAAGFVSQVNRRPNVRTVEFNPVPSETANLFGEVYRGPATTTVPAFVEELFSGG